MYTLKCRYQKSSGDITQNVTNKSNVARHMLNTRIRPGTWIRYPTKFATRFTSSTNTFYAFGSV